MTNKTKNGLAVIETTLEGQILGHEASIKLRGPNDLEQMCLQKTKEALEICQALREAVPDLPDDAQAIFGEGVVYERDCTKLLNDFIGEGDE